ncbi:ATP/GTP-binding protein [uncultured Clostridium sp.]|uniref:AAA family ATPase n=1 Tax=uncultured Clostridium sp. TaxID=59620 RepID=UPI0025D245F6|nr:AAA family ATPase [uncultured Clostridium sp.]
MKILRITAQGVPLFKEDLDLCFYTQQRVSEDDRDRLYNLVDNYYLHSACAFIGINASGKTSVLKVINLALSIVRNEPINHVESRSILGGAEKAAICIYFYDNRKYICCLETVITAKKAKTGNYIYSILSERRWEKPIYSVKSKKYLTDFTGIEPVAIRSGNEEYLSDDVSFIIAHNKKTGDTAEVFSLLSYTNVNVLPFTDDIPLEVIAFLDPTIEKLCFEETEGKTYIHLRFRGEDEIILNKAEELEQYLSSGTIKGIITFSMVKEVLQSGGYLLVDEIENHFNKEIVTTLIRFFMDSRLNKKGGTLIFTTHYPELLDEYDRNDGICIVRNRNGITVENLSYILKRNDIKKSDAYQSGFLEGTTPAYEAYMRLKKSLAASIN